MLAHYFQVSEDALPAIAVMDPRAAVAVDVDALRATQALPAPWLLSGLVYDVATGVVEIVLEHRAHVVHGFLGLVQAGARNLELPPRDYPHVRVEVRRMPTTFTSFPVGVVGNEITVTIELSAIAGLRHLMQR